MNEQTSENTELNTVAELIYFVTGAINVFLLLRLVFKAFGANSGSAIVQLVYSVTHALLLPFAGIFQVAAAGESVIEPSILVAILIYTLFARGVVELLYILAGRKGEEPE